MIIAISSAHTVITWHQCAIVFQTILCRFLLTHAIISVNPLWPRDAIWRHLSTLAETMACCLMVRNFPVINRQNELENCWPEMSFKFIMDHLVLSEYSTYIFIWMYEFIKAVGNILLFYRTSLGEACTLSTANLQIFITIFRSTVSIIKLILPIIYR